MNHRRLVAVAVFLVMQAAAVRALHAYPEGITGLSGNPATNGGLNCNVCHSGGVAPTVTITGPTSVATGATNTYTLRISGGQQVGGGLDVSADDGELSVSDPGTQLIKLEVTHTSPRPVDGNLEVLFSFNWTAPLNAANVVLYGSGNSVNLDGTHDGDQATSTLLPISVGGGLPTPGESSGPGDAPLLVTSYNKIDGDMAITFGTTCEATNYNIYHGPLNQVGTLALDGSWCSIGATGTYAGFNPQRSDSYFFLVVANRSAFEGSYGRNKLPGGAENERVPYAGNACGKIQSLAQRCD